MANIQLSDGVSNRRIPVPELTRSIRIELAGADGPRVIVPSDVAVERTESADEAAPLPK